ncbi:MAG: hypothetical protein WCL21_16670 [Mariniphaga sp.]
MFFLGSISGILPYILAFSLTIIWGGHAGMPFLKAGVAEESKNEIAAEKKVTSDQTENFVYADQIVTAKTFNLPVLCYSESKLLGFYTFRIIDYCVLGISLLRAPPVSPF